jgi:glutathione S-transferase
MVSGATSGSGQHHAATVDSISVMRLYTYGGSANGYKAELLLALLERRYERIEVAIFSGEARTPEFLAMNPAGRIPVLVLDDGTCLPESNAILWHLARDTPFMPRTTAEQDRALGWLMFEQSEVEPTIGSARFWIKTGRARERRDELERRLAWGRQSIALLDRELTDKPFLVGGRASVADLAVYAYTHLAPEIDLALGEHVTAWCARIAALPGYVGATLRYDPAAQLG